MPTESCRKHDRGRTLTRRRCSASGSVPRRSGRRPNWPRSPATAHDAEATDSWIVVAQRVVADARRTAELAALITPNAGGWLALAEAEYARAHGGSDPHLWNIAAVAWVRLERPPLAAYCQWREGEALLEAGAARSEAAVPLRSAYAVATRLSAAPLASELEALARRGRVDLRAPRRLQPTDPDLAKAWGLTPRETEVLSLIAQGCTNREIARTLVISEKTTGVHVTHILHKLQVPTRLEAAAIAHRVVAISPAGVPARSPTSSLVGAARLSPNNDPVQDPDMRPTPSLDSPASRRPPNRADIGDHRLRPVESIPPTKLDKS